MSRYIVLFCAALLALLPSSVWARDSLWKTTAAIATCEAYDRLHDYLERFEYNCKSVAPRFHENLIEEDWVRGARLSACYIGSINHILPIPASYECSVFTDRSEYHHIVCTRDYPEDQVAHEQYTLSDWQTALVTGAKSLKSCADKNINFAFTGPTLTPHMLLDRFKHEHGLALSEGDSLMYLGTGSSKSCGPQRDATARTMGVLSFFTGGQEPMRSAEETVGTDPFFWERNVEIGKGLQLTFTDMRDLDDIQRRFDPDFSWGSMPAGVSFSLSVVGIRAQGRRE